MKATSDGPRRPRSAANRSGGNEAAVLLVVVSALTISARADNPVDFRRDVAPILERHCVRCHEPANRKGKLSLTTFADLAAGEHVVPGRPEESGLLELVSPPEPGRRPEMPKQGAPLSADQVDVLRRWIAEGARWPTDVVLEAKSRPETAWWSLRPLAEVAPPASVPGAPGADWATNPIDRFILAKLAEKGLLPSPPADRRTLIRRVYFDLTGLPPTPGEVDSFLNDTDPAAYEKLVDRLLASPCHGERWARHWLDVIHFADSHGHEHDVLRPHAWRYRDYVIDSLNRDTPWPRFIREQMAADVFFPAEPSLIPALGFLAAGPYDASAAGTAPRMFEYLDRDDLVTQTMAAFASTTVNCARCHDHKFDPITQEDYFALQAVFAGVTKGDLAFDRDLAVAGKRKRYRALVAAAESRRRDVLLSPETASLVALWERYQPPEWTSLNVEALHSSSGAALERQSDGSIVSGGPCPDKETYTLTLAGAPPEITALRLDVLADPALPHQGPGRGEKGNLYLSELEATLVRPRAGPEKLLFRGATADWNQPDWAVARALDGNPQTAWGIDPQVGQSHHAVFELAQGLALGAGSKLVVVLKQMRGGGQLIGRFRLSATGATPEAAIALPDEAAAARALPCDKRTPQQGLALAAAVLSAHAERELSRLPAPDVVFAAAPAVENEKGSITTIPEPRVIRVLKRGELDDPGAEVPPGTLSTVSALKARFDQLDPQDEAARRAALADWLADPRNPLTWRSIANRVWQYHFGCGLCDTPSDFGCMGGTPSHPELLDWLAAFLRSRGGSLKDLHRLICSSAVYRQSSTHSAAAAAIDPDNRLLWRMSRRRLDAEGFRDTVLALSGRLDLTGGGPGVAQFQLRPGANPPNQVPTPDYSAFDWDSPGATRRSIYRVVWRGAPDPFMNALDFPDAALLAPVRGVSESPLQALSLLNNDFVLRHCEHLAARVEGLGTTRDERVRAAFRLTLLREPTASERTDFVALAAKHSLAAVCRVLLNCNEFLFVE
jgi:hypothetical protein